MIVSGIPHASVNLIDLGLYGEDDWRARPNMTLSLGLRFETQNDIHDHADIAPRVGFAWGLGHGKSPKTVLRAGFGIFYDRFMQTQVLQAERLNGINQQEFIFSQPDFFPEQSPVPEHAGGLCRPLQPLRTSTRLIRTCERRIRCRRAWAWSGNYQRMPLCPSPISTRTGFISFSPATSMHPFPERIPLETPRAGVRPYQNFANIPNVGNIYQYESAGLFNQNQLITNFNLRMGTKLMLFGFYTLGYADSKPAASRVFR